MKLQTVQGNASNHDVLRMQEVNILSKVFGAIRKLLFIESLIVPSFLP